MARTILLLGTFLVCLLPAVESVLCTYRDTFRTKTLYCSNGCCGSEWNRYCCSYVYVTGGAIAGIVIGCLSLIAIIVSIVVCICCCAKKSRATTGQVVNQGGAMITATSTSNYPNAYPNQGYNYGPPEYNPGMATTNQAAMYPMAAQPPAYPAPATDAYLKQ